MKLIGSDVGSGGGVALEFKLEDCWVGLFWKRTRALRRGVASSQGCVGYVGRVDVWICLLPCLPVHAWWWQSGPGPLSRAWRRVSAWLS